MISVLFRRTLSRKTRTLELQQVKIEDTKTTCRDYGAIRDSYFDKLYDNNNRFMLECSYINFPFFHV